MEVVGHGPAAVRLYSVLTGVATVLAVFGLARDWFGERTAQVAALIVAVAPFHVQYSQEARMYALLALVLTLATWAYWRAWHGRGRGYWVAFGALAGLSMYVQQLAALFLAAIGLLPFLARDLARIARTALAAGLAVALYLPWMVNLPHQMGKLRHYWVQRPNVLHLWLALRSFVSVNLDFSATWWLPTFLMAALLTVLLLYRACHALRAPQQDDMGRRAVGWTIWLAFAPMILMWIVSHVFQPVFLPRALLPSAVIWYGALAWLFTQADVPRLIVGLLVAAWGLVVVFGLVTHFTWARFPTPPFDDAVAYVSEHWREGDVVVHGNKITALPMIYYGRDLPQRYVRDIPGSGSDTLAVPTQRALGLLADGCAAEAARGSPRVWYVAFEQLADEMAELIRDDPANAHYDSLAWLRAHYHEVGRQSFNDLDVYLFATPDERARQTTCAGD